MDIQSLRRRFAGRLLRSTLGRGEEGPLAALPATGIFRILVCRSSHSLGNTLLLTPLLQEIEALWPGAEIDIVSRNPIAAELFRNYASVRHVFCLPRRGLRHPLQLAAALRRLTRQEYDLAIDTDPRSHTGRALLLRSRARWKLGFSGGAKSGALSHAVAITAMPRHHGHYPVELLRTVAARRRSGYPPLDLRLSGSEREQGAQILSRLLAQEGPGGDRGVVGVFANATGGKLLSKCWWQRFMPLVEAHFRDFRFVEIVPASAVSMLDSRYPSYYSSDVRRLAGVLSQLSLLICLDGGIMHLARAAGTCTAAVFAGTEIAEWGPYGERAYAIDGLDLPPEQVAQRLVGQVPPPLPELRAAVALAS